MKNTPLQSHPTWVRGLKLDGSQLRVGDIWSHPTWVRGLKHNSSSRQRHHAEVAPYVGAWIETYRDTFSMSQS